MDGVKKRVEARKTAAQLAEEAGDKLRQNLAPEAGGCYWLAIESHVDSALACFAVHPRRPGSRLSVLEMLARLNPDLFALLHGYYRAARNNLAQAKTKSNALAGFAAGCASVDAECQRIRDNLVPLLRSYQDN